MVLRTLSIFAASDLETTETTCCRCLRKLSSQRTFGLRNWSTTLKRYVIFRSITIFHARYSFMYVLRSLSIRFIQGSKYFLYHFSSFLRNFMMGSNFSSTYFLTFSQSSCILSQISLIACQTPAREFLYDFPFLVTKPTTTLTTLDITLPTPPIVT